MSVSIHDLLLHWQKQVWTDPHVRWEKTWLSNGFCAECRRCCGPQIGDPPYPMPLLASQLRPNMTSYFYMMDESTACLDERGCKSLGEHGCLLDRAMRPLSCGIFPLVLLEGSLFLYMICPASLCIPLQRWFDLAHSVASWMQESLSLAEQKRISLHVPDNRERFIPLYTDVF